MPTAQPAPARAAFRSPSRLDGLLDGALNALGTVGGTLQATRSNPATGTPDLVLEDAERQHAAGLMRINHVGEVCAQALYMGQAAVARDSATRAELLAAAQDETDHLVWCAQRLGELESRPSWLNPLWYAGSYSIGVLAGLRGDGWNLGFVVETERQVEAHLAEHLQQLPQGDARSRAILQQMKIDEGLHADHAQTAGARTLPFPVPNLMRVASRVMKTVAYSI